MQFLSVCGRELLTVLWCKFEASHLVSRSKYQDAIAEQGNLLDLIGYYTGGQQIKNFLLEDDTPGTGTDLYI